LPKPAEVVLWWITHQPEAIAITTAPSWTQVERLLWGEIHNAVYHSRIQYPKPSTSALRLGPGRYAIGLSTNEGVRFQGFHGSVLIVLDEAPGIRPEIWEAIEGIRAAGNVRVLALGNPTITSGPFYEAFTSGREGWNLITISAFDTPNLAGLSLEAQLPATIRRCPTVVGVNAAGVDDSAKPAKTPGATSVSRLLSFLDPLLGGAPLLVIEQLPARIHHARRLGWSPAVTISPASSSRLPPGTSVPHWDRVLCRRRPAE
jgi:hypothetical protein